MIVRAVKKLFSRRPRVINADVHGITLKQIDSDAQAAVKKLQKAGYETYLVGGAVRDLLLQASPKDFDVSTAATPTEVRAIFRRARIIGRRFKIVHLTSYRHGQRYVIEVTTFRTDGEGVVEDEAGRILRDNTFGNAAQDAVRRDFTCNALFYDPSKQQILDYVGGYKDIKNHKLCMIGSPIIRFREDPVRIIRALRLYGKLGLQIDKSLSTAARKCAPLLADIAPSRLFDETIKIINSGAAAATFASCAEFGIDKYILPSMTYDKFSEALLKQSDSRNKAGKEISLSFMLAGLFWTPVSEKWNEFRGGGMQSVRAMEKALDTISFATPAIVPRRIIARLIDVYFLQSRMETPPSYRRANGLLRHPLFKRAVAFAALREDGKVIAKWWKNYQSADAEQRAELIKQARDSKE
ncbi:MAG: polynucleotide adenylyltransferase PcnB [Gammaproteobacteria bacterium WSBS_2016_MAG_OTU1]